MPTLAKTESLLTTPEATKTLLAGWPLPNVAEDLRRLTETLRHSEARYRQMMMFASDAIIIADKNGRSIEVNRRAGELLGCPPQELVGRALRDLIHPDDLPALLAGRERVRAGERASFQWRIRHHSGDWLDVELSACLLPDGTMMAQVRDVSARQRLEHERDALLAGIAAKQARLQAVMDHAPVAIGLWDDSGPPLFNRFTAALCGVPPGELTHQRHALLAYVRRLDGTPATAADLAATETLATHGPSAERELLVLRPDGTRRTVAGSAAPIRDGSGRQIGAVGVYRDVTEERRTAQALRDSEERFRSAFALAPMAMTLSDPQGRIRHANAALCVLTGYREEELIGKTYGDITHPDERAATAARFAETVAGTLTGFQVRKRLLHKNGQALWALVSGAPVLDGAGQVAYIIGQAVDVAEQVRAERALRLLAAAGERLHASLDVQRIAAALADLLHPALTDACRVALLGDGEAALADHDSPSAGPSDSGHDSPNDSRDSRVIVEEIRAADPELLTTLHRFLGAPPYDPARSPLLSATLRAQAPLSVLVDDDWKRAHIADPGRREVVRSVSALHVLGVPLRAHGRTLGAILAKRLVKNGPFTADEVQLVQELAGRAAAALENGRLYHEAQRAKQVREQVLRGVTHDLRGLLNVIALSAEVLRPGRALPPERVEGCRQGIRRHVARASGLIGDLLLSAQASAGTLAVVPAAHDPAALCALAADPWRPVLKERRLDLQIAVAAALPQVRADGDLVVQVLGHLLDNASQHTPPGGRIVLSAAPDAHDAPDSPDAADPYDKDAVRFSVSDSGPGTPAAHLSRLFRPFWQAGPDKEIGVALGLSIARSMIEAHGGRIWARSTAGEGTTFSFTLQPWRASDGAAAADPTAARPPPPAPMPTPPMHLPTSEPDRSREPT